MDDHALYDMLQENVFLLRLVQLAEMTPAAPRVTLLVSGTVVTGTIISLLDWGAAYRTYLQSMQHGTGVTDDTQQLLDGIEVVHNFLKAPEHNRLRAFVHLKDVQVNGQSLPVLRVRLDQIAAWGFSSPGAIEGTPVESPP